MSDKQNVQAGQSEMSLEEAMRVVRELEDQLWYAKETVRALRSQTTRQRTQPRECGCGCGETTSGGTFRPGHDAKLRSRLLVIIRGADEEAGRQALAHLQSYPRLAHGVGEWDLGRDAKEAARKEARKAERDAATAASKIAREGAAAAAKALTQRSRDETRAAAEAAQAEKEAAYAKARAEGTRTVPEAK